MKRTKQRERKNNQPASLGFDGESTIGGRLMSRSERLPELPGPIGGSGRTRDEAPDEDGALATSPPAPARVSACPPNT
jgi:hypothetical protein